MPFELVNVASKNKLGELPVYVTQGENLSSAVIVLQEVGFNKKKIIILKLYDLHLIVNI